MLWNWKVKRCEKKEVFCVTILFANILYQWQMNESMEHWWNYRGTRKPKYLGAKSVPVPLCPLQDGGVNVTMPSTHITGMCSGCSCWTNMHQALELHWCVCVCVYVCYAVHNGCWIIILQHSILHSRVGLVWVTFIKFISDCYMFWSYRLSSGNIIHNLTLSMCAWEC
jgi:hypothetical protein